MIQLKQALSLGIGIMIPRHCLAFQFRPIPIQLPSSSLRASISTSTNTDKEMSVVELSYTEFASRKEASTGVPNHGSADPVVRVRAHEHEPVILLHGLLGSKRNFSTLGSAIAKQIQKQRRVFTVDLRNHGDNNHDWREEMTYTDMANDVLHFMDKMGFETAVLIGHSMGGKVSKALALLHPHRVTGLVVIDIAPVRYTEEDGGWRAVKSIIDTLAQITLLPHHTKKDVDKELRKTIEDPALRAFVLTNLDQQKPTDTQQQHILTWKINIQAISKGLDVIAGFDLDSNVEGKHDLCYDGDTFFIHGGASRFVRHAHMQTIAQLFPNHMLTTIRGAGHWVHAEAPDDTLALIKKYLDR